MFKPLKISSRTRKNGRQIYRSERRKRTPRQRKGRKTKTTSRVHVTRSSRDRAMMTRTRRTRNHSKSMSGKESRERISTIRRMVLLGILKEIKLTRLRKTTSPRMRSYKRNIRHKR